MASAEVKGMLMILFYVLVIPYSCLIVEVSICMIMMTQKPDFGQNNFMSSYLDNTTFTISTIIYSTLSLAISLLMVATVFHISVSLQMLGLQMTIDRAKTIRNIAYFLCKLFSEQ